MTYASGTTTAGQKISAAFSATLTALGFTRVTTDWAVTATGTVQVWKSSGNTAGQDWYLFLVDVLSAGSRGLQCFVSEGWDDATKTISGFAPFTTAQVPLAADFRHTASGVVITSGNFGGGGGPYFGPGSTLVVDTGGRNWWLNATKDRVIYGLQAAGIAPTNIGDVMYAGHLDRVLPLDIDPVQPLVALSLQAGSGSGAAFGMATREAAGVTSNANNWRVQLYSNASTQMDSAFTPQGSFYGLNLATGRAFTSPVIVHQSRSVGASNRGLLKDVRVLASGGVPSSVADTLTEYQQDGSTKSYFCVNTPGAIFVPSA